MLDIIEMYANKWALLHLKMKLPTKYSFKNHISSIDIYKYTDEWDLALNDLLRLKCHKLRPSNQPTKGFPIFGTCYFAVGISLDRRCSSSGKYPLWLVVLWQLVCWHVLRCFFSSRDLIALQLNAQHNQISILLLYEGELGHNVAEETIKTCR